MQLTLDELIPIYGEQNTQCNALKKTVAELNTQLKQAIKENLQENKDIIASGWKCKLSITDESTFNEDRLIDFAKAHNIDVVRTKEYIDYDALENLIYNNQIEKDVLVEMNSCKDAKTKETLRISKMKEH